MQEKGETVSDIINREGEEVFRVVERETLLDIISSVKGRSGGGKMVVSAGGGTPCYFDNMDIMRSAGVCVWLRLPVETLVSRLSVSREERPLIANVCDDRLVCTVGRHLTMRTVFYSKAHIAVDVRGLSPDAAADLIISELENNSVQNQYTFAE